MVVNNPSGIPQAVTVQSTLPPQLTGVAGSCTWVGGSGMPTCVVNSGGMIWTGGLPANSAPTIHYQVQVGAAVPPGTTLCIDTSADNGSGPVTTQVRVGPKASGRSIFLPSLKARR